MRLVEDEHSIYEMDEECIKDALDERENAQPIPQKPSNPKSSSNK